MAKASAGSALVVESDYELLAIHRDPEARCTFCIAIDSTALGPAFGGIRRWRYPTVAAAVADVLELARAMSRKCALAEVAGGGGKAVVLDAPALDREAAYRALGLAVESLAGRFRTGPDVGTTAADLEQVATATRFVARPGAGGPGDLAGATALGVFAGIAAVAQRIGKELVGLRVAVQGVGAVGSRLAQRLAEAGARLWLADADDERAAACARRLDAEVVAADAIVGADCDVLAPCALGRVLDDDALSRLRARAVAGAANNVLASPHHGEALFARGVLVAPDFVINAGALIQGAVFDLDGAAPPPSRIAAIGATVGALLDRALSERRPPEQIATEVADQRLARARTRRDERSSR